jgi:hypothetical protein
MCCALQGEYQINPKSIRLPSTGSSSDDIKGNLLQVAIAKPVPLQPPTRNP